MYSNSIDWKLVVNQSRTAVVKINKSQPISAIEPDIVFTHNTIAIYATSNTAKPNWYKAGNLYQAFPVPFGTAGAAQGESIGVVLNRYTIHRFTVFPDTGDTKYVISFAPQTYLKDIKLQVWEYTGINQGATLDSLETLAKANLQRSAGLQTSINKLLKKG
ncbi:MAG: hypothetical protein V7K64_13560 [Nostoc sp.]|uniref:hypothetical protein n=1 Tax=Nostoc sp. TaxID=1180 RepID=UPI002FF7D2F2